VEFRGEFGYLNKAVETMGSNNNIVPQIMCKGNKKENKRKASLLDLSELRVCKK
jgi:hypothetical protein